MNPISLTPTLEDYLETIYRICEFNKVARSMEIADRLNVKRSSVTVALRSLAEKGLINYQARSFVTLTEDGLNTAKCVDKKHNTLLDIFTTVFGISQDDADKTACEMEHGMTSLVCKKMNSLLKALRDDQEMAGKLAKAISESEKDIECKNGCSMKPGKSEEKIGDMHFDLNSMKPGERGIIKMILGSGNLKKRLLEMGITKGQEILIVRAAPLDDPIEVQVRNFNLSLRREEAALIIIDKVI